MVSHDGGLVGWWMCYWSLVSLMYVTGVFFSFFFFSCVVFGLVFFVVAFFVFFSFRFAYFVSFSCFGSFSSSCFGSVFMFMFLGRFYFIQCMSLGFSVSRFCLSLFRFHFGLFFLPCLMFVFVEKCEVGRRGMGGRGRGREGSFRSRPLCLTSSYLARRTWDALDT